MSHKWASTESSNDAPTKSIDSLSTRRLLIRLTLALDNLRFDGG